MPDKKLDRRMPFGLDVEGVRQPNAILSRAGNGIAEEIRNSFSADLQEEIIDIQWCHSDSEARSAAIDHARRRSNERLESAICQYAIPEYLVDCSDQTSNHHLSLDDLLAFRNYDNAAITTLKASIGKYSDDFIQLLLRSDQEYFPNVQCGICGSYNFINGYNLEFENWFRSIRKKYYWAYNHGSLLAFP